MKENRFRATPLDVALYVWINSADTSERERCYEVIALLARAGAKLDPQQWCDPDEDRPGVLVNIRADPRMQAALRGEVPAGPPGFV